MDISKPTKPNPRRIDLSGRQFGRWTVIEYSCDRKWLCRCECGTERSVYAPSLTTGVSVSCGCYKNECVSKRSKTHGLSRAPIYKIWQMAIDRCHNPKSTRYEYYGGRGITVCDRWLESFVNFLEDMGERPSDDHTLERRDNHGPYSPENCSWETIEVQRNNTRANRRITYQGKTQTLNQWAKELGIDRTTLRDRLNKGMTAEEAITIPLTTAKTMTLDERTMTLSEWAKETGIPLTTIKSRIRSRWSVKNTLTP